MKKSIALVAALSALSVHAEDGVTIYGVLDAALGQQRFSRSEDLNFPPSVNPVSALPASVRGSVTGLFNGGIQDSRIGFKGTEDLGDGMKAFFTLESGINANDGMINNAGLSMASNSGPSANNITASGTSSLNGQFFNRQSFVGLSSDKWGSVALGRNYNQIFDVVVSYDPVQAAQLFSPLGMSGTYGGGGGESENVRLDNSVKYTNRIGAWNFGALYKFGGVAGLSNANGGAIVNGGYETPAFGIQAVYEKFTDISTAKVGSTANTLAGTTYNQSAFVIAARYSLANVNLKAGAESYTLSAASDTTTALGITSLDGQAATVTSYTGAPAKVNVYWFGGDYNVTGALNISAGVYNVHSNAVGTANNAGNIYMYSALADYHLSKRTDVYAGLMFEQYKGALYTVAAADNTNNCIFGFGLRHKF